MSLALSGLTHLGFQRSDNIAIADAPNLLPLRKKCHVFLQPHIRCLFARLQGVEETVQIDKVLRAGWEGRESPDSHTQMQLVVPPNEAAAFGGHGPEQNVPARRPHTV